MAGRKPTRAEGDGITEFVQELVARGLRKSLIKQAFRRKAMDGHIEYGVGQRQIEAYIARARKANEKVAEHDRYWWGDYITLQMAADMNDPKATKNERARTAEIICKMKGLYVPLQHEHSGPDGKPLEIVERVIVEEETGGTARGNNLFEAGRLHKGNGEA